MELQYNNNAYDGSAFMFVNGRNDAAAPKLPARTFVMLCARLTLKLVFVFDVVWDHNPTLARFLLSLFKYTTYNNRDDRSAWDALYDLALLTLDKQKVRYLTLNLLFVFNLFPVIILIET